MKKGDFKFRAFDKKEKKWLLGYELPNLGGFSMFGEVMLFGEWAKIVDEYVFERNGHKFEDIEVTQFTGLKEGGVETGRDIYFGDIMRAPSGNHFEVIWYEDEMRIAIRFQNTIYNFNVPLYKIAGNRFDNPELIV